MGIYGIIIRLPPDVRKGNGKHDIQYMYSTVRFLIVPHKYAIQEVARRVDS